jgi:hypothetical protein
MEAPMMTWLDLFPQFRLPAPGSFVQPIAPVTTWFSPTIEVNYMGNPEIEREIVTEVAGYGSQLGSLIDAVIEIADGKGGPAMQKLYELKNDVDSVKDRHRGDDAGRARMALAALARSDPAALREVVAEFSGPAL